MPELSRVRRRGLAAAGLSLALLPALLVLPAGASTAGATAGGSAGASGRPAVIGRRVLGHSVQGRPIVAWHLGEPGHTTVVLISVMHGNEPAPRRILTDLRDGAPVHDLNLWVVPVYNPDGLAHHTRQNAHGVDPNRNYPYQVDPPDRELQLGAPAGVRARDPGDDALPLDASGRRTSCRSTSRCTPSTSPSDRRSRAAWPVRSACR